MTRRLSCLPALAALAVAGAPAAGQSLEEAARANLGIAIELCLSTAIGNGPVRAQAFRNAGFAERVDRSATNSDTTHVFSAPANTATAELYYGEMPQSCMAMTGHLGVSAASEVLDRTIPRIFPGYTRFETLGPPDPATGRPARCVRYEEPNNPIGHVVGVVPAGQSDCIENGTSRIYSSYRV